MGWSTEEIELVRLAAPMYDVGKVGIPDSILQKPGALTEEEWKVMRLHTAYGNEILEGGESRLLEIARELALDHHERRDGAGYPNGKAGEEISICGRMTAISDVFDALTSKRHYKQPWPTDQVVEHIKSERGHNFVPEIADVFLSKMDTMLEIKAEYEDV